MELKENVPLAQFTTLGIGGPARWLVEATGEDDIPAAVRFARAHGAPYFILGGGSNLLVSDDGFPGVVIRMSSANLGWTEEGGGIDLLWADSGVEWDTVVRAAIDRNAAGIECLAGIPGSAGATPVQNVGAYGQEVADSIAFVEAIDLQTGRKCRLEKDDCGFAYRRSIFNTTRQGRYAITHVTYRLKLGGAPHLAYRDVKQYFAERGIALPSLTQTAAAVREIRARKGMLLSPDDPDSRSAGSFFKNPIVPAARVPGLAALAGCHPDHVPQFPAGDDLTPDHRVVKLSAAWLIELAGFRKGFALGRAGLSSKHTLAIVNLGNATAAEIIALRDLVRAEVHARFAIRLEQEPVLLGFPPHNL